MLLIDQLAYRSKLRFESPMMKALFAISILLMAVSLRSVFFGIIVTIFMGIITVKAGKIPLMKYLHLLKIPLVFILLSVLAIIVNISQSAFPGIGFFLGKFYIGISKTGIWEAAAISMTAFGAVSCLYFLALSTPMTDILYILRKIHCPAILVELMLLIYRFIFVLLDIAHALSVAQKSRLGNRNLSTSLHAAGSLMSVLFLRSFRKSSFLYDAMESRCYDGQIRVLYVCKRAEKKQIAFVVGTVAGFCIIAYMLNSIGL